MTIDLRAAAKAELKRREEARLRDAARAELARRSFWEFRRFLHRKKRMKWGWWQREVAAVLEQFRADLEAGLRPKYVIQAPPQHGKSVQVVEFLAWLAGHNPDLKTIYASFSERLGVRANLMLQRIMDSPAYRAVFPDTRLGSGIRNREMLEYDGREGYFRNTTVRGSVTGEGLDLGVIDDPIKGREQAGSPAIRNNTWEWLTDDFMTRFSDGAGMLAILTRWHVDDPIGRLIDAVPGVKVFSYPAIATQDEPHRKAGEALFPEHKSLEFLLERKAAKGANVPLTGRLRILDMDSGMIGIPDITEQGVRVKYLLDTQTTLGGALRIVSKLNPAASGDYCIYKLSFDISSRDTSWYWIAEAKRL